MDRNEINQGVYSVSQVLKIEPGQILEEHAFTADLGADSVQSIALMAAFEEEFDIEMDDDEALATDSCL